MMDLLAGVGLGVGLFHARADWPHGAEAEQEDGKSLSRAGGLAGVDGLRGGGDHISSMRVNARRLVMIGVMPPDLVF